MRKKRQDSDKQKRQDQGHRNHFDRLNTTTCFWASGKDADKFLKVHGDSEEKKAEEKKARANRNWFRLKELAEEGFSNFR